MDMRSEIENRIDDKAEDTALPAEDVLSALIARFGLNPRTCSAIRFNIIST